MSEATNFSLQGKVVVQCGGTGLLGRELVKAIGQAGATLIVGTRDPAKYGPELERAKAAGVEVQVHPLIVS